MLHQLLQWLVCAPLEFCSGLFCSSLGQMGCQSREEGLKGNVLARDIFVCPVSSLELHYCVHSEYLRVVLSGLREGKGHWLRHHITSLKQL